MAKDNIERSRIFAEEEAIVNVQSFLHEIMEERGVSRAELARAMGVSRARVTQLFSDECTNLTLRLLARALFALGEELAVSTVNSVRRERGPVNREEACARQPSWVEVKAEERSDSAFAFSANDNVFNGLAYLRRKRVPYEMAA